MMKTMSFNVEVQSSEVLRKLYEVFDELGMVQRFSEELAEVEIRIGDQWFMFYVDDEVLKDEAADKFWSEDAYAVAEGYWRQ